MRTTTELDRRKAHLLKAARTAIRLKHSLQADEEIMRDLPELERRIDEALANGEGFTLDIADVLREIGSGEEQ